MIPKKRIITVEPSQNVVTKKRKIVEEVEAKKKEEPKIAEKRKIEFTPQTFKDNTAALSPKKNSIFTSGHKSHKDEKQTAPKKKKKRVEATEKKPRLKGFQLYGIDYAVISEKLMDKLKERSDVELYQEVYEDTYLFMIPVELLVKLNYGDTKVPEKLLGKKTFARKAAAESIVTFTARKKKQGWVIWYEDKYMRGQYAANPNTESPIRGYYYNEKQLEKTMFASGYGDVIIEYRDSAYCGVKLKKIRLVTAYNNMQNQTILTNAPVNFWDLPNTLNTLQRNSMVYRMKNAEAEANLMLFVNLKKDNIVITAARANQQKAMEKATATEIRMSVSRDQLIEKTKEKFANMVSKAKAKTSHL